MDKELEKLNKNKVGALHYPGSLIIFLAYLHTLLSRDYRGLEGFLRGLSKLVSLGARLFYDLKQTPNKKHLNPIRGKRRGEWMRHKWKVHNFQKIEGVVWQE
ncbi:MAG: hypothetical protein H5T44_05525 [Thermoplasmatales archaeon]|nr:hypothetical protein [Thermoplasmatales archaeon]